jgi:CRP-like cAMP-binding protein
VNHCIFRGAGTIDTQLATVDLAVTGLEKFVTRLRLRTPLSDADEAAILSLKGQEVRVAAHRDVIRPGDRSQHATLVLRGLIGRFDQLANGSRQITALHIPGDMCDLHSVAVPHAGWGIQALSTALILSIPHAALMRLYHDRPNVALAFWRDTTVDASILAKWISALGRREAVSRLAHLICEMGMRMEQVGLGTRGNFRLAATQSQLADVLGITTVHLNRSLQALRQKGLMTMEDSQVTVIDEGALWAIADFDPTYLLLEPV